MKKTIDNVIRFLVGGLFIFSGLIKLNDPIGTKIKMEEYFSIFSAEFASFFEWFVPAALPIAMFLIILEVVLGIAVLLNYRMRITSWVLLLLILFFTFLTFYSAYTGKVTDCGCFGDAIPLTPWESFIKDVILLILIGHIFWYRRHYEPVISERAGNIVVVSAAVISLLIGIYAIEHLPYLDFRPYKVGASIPANMQPPEQPIIEYIFEKEGETVRSREFLSGDEYTFVDSEVINEEESTPKIQDYQAIGPSGEDFTQESFQGVKVIIVMQSEKTLRADELPRVSSLVQQLEELVPTVIFTSLAEQKVEELRHEYQIPAPFYFVDGTVLKAMIRSDPGIILLKDGTVLGKWHINDIPQPGEIAGRLP